MARQNGITRGDREARGAHLKERIYLSFSALAVVSTMGGHGDPTAGEAAVTLFVTALGTLLAVFTADVISHTIVNEHFPSRHEVAETVRTTFSAAIAIVPVFLLLAAAGVGWWETTTALRASTVVLVASLVLIGWVAVRRVPLTFWQRALALAAEAVLGVAVVLLQRLAHG
ncbi:hypothetical protein [Microbacterium indicum]|uniref:hypothetical protein n=1 Tax=Microbacterium indicum TaxID=358100 RepID=UPI00041D43AA|nr:hypothetical protein [Microbacterium indicum]